MPRVTSTHSIKKHSQIELSEYITKVCTSSQGLIAATSAAGEVVLWSTKTLTPLLEAGEASIDCLGFSADGVYLAAGGQGGKLYVWNVQANNELVATIDCEKKWLEHLAWSPQGHTLAFSWGRYVQIWQFPQNEIITTLSFEKSTVLGLAWRPLGQELAVIGDQGVKVWSQNDWDNDPIIYSTSTATLGLAWSPDGSYIAANCLDQTISLTKWETSAPWMLHGFPGKVRHLAWSGTKEPLLAMCSLDEIVVWKRSKKASEGWNSEILTAHKANIMGVSFALRGDLLASIDEAGSLGLWSKGKQLIHFLEGAAKEGFSCLAWSPDGGKIITGGQNGEVIIWQVIQRGQGFA